MACCHKTQKHQFINSLLNIGSIMKLVFFSLGIVTAICKSVVGEKHLRHNRNLGLPGRGTAPKGTLPPIDDPDEPEDVLFSRVGQGFCLDAWSKNYSYIKGVGQSSYTECLDYCSQNPNPGLVGASYDSTHTECYCMFSPDVPLSIGLWDYIPDAQESVIDAGFNGVARSDSTSGVVCYQNMVSDVRAGQLPSMHDSHC